MNIQETPEQSGKRCGLFGLSEDINPYPEGDYRYMEWWCAWCDGQMTTGAIPSIDWVRLRIDAAED